MSSFSLIRGFGYSMYSKCICRLYSKPSIPGLLYSNYQSSISLQNLYPSSTLRLTTPTKVPDKADSKFNGYIPIESLIITYSRSSGPGGQHVNTVNTKVDLRVHLESAGWLHPDIRASILEKHKNKISKDGCLIIKSDKTRSQQLNLADAMERLRAIIQSAEFVPTQPTPETVEQIRRRKEKASQSRLIEKRMKSSIKASRREEF